ncbi:lipase/acyltransferase domain-containing protein [Ensifer adhaerens]|uniref:lipase/acyltransferase domain-containing protein n=1 Tax=Ensifer adhaerens TaxID=106592 RepID=UPI0015EC6003|nr:hypothetical protein [Ensifer adhaerens]
MTKHPDLVVLLPGIIGSVLMKDREILWGRSAKFFWDAATSKALDRLKVSGEDNGDEDLDDGVEATALLSNITIVPRLWKATGYSTFSDYLGRNLALVKNENYFEFPYDWRRDNRVSARKLERFCHEKLKRWRDTSGNEKAKIILVSHSMGGLVSRYFIECLGGWKDTRMLISLGTPYRGSLDALDGICNGVTKTIGGVTLADGSLAFRSFQSLYQLLPIYPVVKDKDEKLERVANLNLPNMSQSRAIAARNFHDEIQDAYARNLRDPAYMREQVKVVPVVGIDQPTYQSARLHGDGRVELLYAYGGKDMGGDGTVPRVSAIHDDNASSTSVYVASKHAVLPDAKATMTHLKGLIEGTTIDLSQFRSSHAPTSITIETRDVYEGAEPVEITATLNGQHRQELTATFTREGNPGQTIQALMYPRNSVYRCKVPLRPGLYTLGVSGSDLDTAGDVFAVIGPEGQLGDE